MQCCHTSHKRPRGRDRRRRQTGAVLIEVMAAFFVVVVGMLPMLGLFLASRSLDQQAQAQAAAYGVARQEVEILAGQKYSNRPVSTGTFTVPASILAQFPGMSMTGRYAITSVSSYGGAKYPVQQVVVEVRWANNTNTNTASSTNGAYSSVRVDTLITQEPNK